MVRQFPAWLPDSPAADFIRARVFAGLSVEEAAASLGISRATAYREWTFARAWLATALSDNSKTT